MSRQRHHLKNGNGINSELKKKLFLLVFVIAFTVLFMITSASAQMTIGYPKRFHLYGLIELAFTNYDSRTEFDNTTRKNWSWTFNQKYQLNFDGYIYHPRLAVFNSYIAFSDTMYKTSYTNPDYKNIGYFLGVNILPYRPVTLRIHTQKTDYTGDTFPSGTFRQEYWEYGIRLWSDYKKLPHMRTEYLHSEVKSGSDFSENTTWSFDMFDFIEKLKTNWGLFYRINENKNPIKNYESTISGFYTSTMLKPYGSFSNILRNIDSDLYKSLRFNSALSFVPGERFSHNYQYRYDDSEYEYEGSVIAGTPFTSIKTKVQQLVGSWGYKLTSRLSLGLALNYNLHDQNSRKWNSYAITPSLHYHRPIARGIDMASSYQFFLREDEERGNFREHSFYTGLKIRKFKWGLIYTNYYFLKSHGEDKIRDRQDEEFFFDEKDYRKSTYDATVHTLNTGIRGNLRGGAGRGYWNFQIEYQNQQTHRKRELGVVYDTFSDENNFLEYSKKLQQTTFSLDIYYPWRKGSAITFKAGYITGTADSRDINTWFYEARLSYPMMRRLLLSAWFRDYYLTLDNGVASNTKNLELILEYRIGRTLFQLSHWIEMLNQDDLKTFDQRFFLRMRRPFG